MTRTNNGANWDAAPRLINMAGDMKKFGDGWDRVFSKRKRSRKGWTRDGVVDKYQGDWKECHKPVKR